MRTFVIHRTHMRSEAHLFLKWMHHAKGIITEPLFLRKSYGKSWKQQAESRMETAEVALVFDTEACQESECTKWEIVRAKELNLPIIELSRSMIDSKSIGAIQSAFDFSDEFNDCFSQKGPDDKLLELYKMMVGSSETLIQRRQITNGFFITAIGTIVGATGFMAKEGLVNNKTSLFLCLPLIVGLLLCRSWRNLLRNYGKLNKGKFAVIHQIEKQLPARIYEAEWISLGKGLRKSKYQSFTKTEENVPVYFMALLFMIFLFIFISAEWSLIYKEYFPNLTFIREWAVENYTNLTLSQAIVETNQDAALP